MALQLFSLAPSPIQAQQPDFSPIGEIGDSILGGIQRVQARGLVEKAFPNGVTQGGTFARSLGIGSPAPNSAPQAPGAMDSYFNAIRSAESGGNDSAKNPLSSATGRYQFTAGTWRGLMASNPELGLTENGRTDPAQQERAIRAFTAQNARDLSSAGIQVNPGSLYAAHFLGSGGARSVLSGDDNAPVSAYVGPEVMKANPFLQGMSVGQFKQWASRKGGGNMRGGYAPPAADDAAGAIDEMAGPPAGLDPLQQEAYDNLPPRAYEEDIDPTVTNSVPQGPSPLTDAAFNARMPGGPNGAPLVGPGYEVDGVAPKGDRVQPVAPTPVAPAPPDGTITGQEVQSAYTPPSGAPAGLSPPVRTNYSPAQVAQAEPISGKLLGQLITNPYTRDLGLQLAGAAQRGRGAGIEFRNMANGDLIRTDQNGNYEVVGNFAKSTSQDEEFGTTPQYDADGKAYQLGNRGTKRPIEGNLRRQLKTYNTKTEQIVYDPQTSEIVSRTPIENREAKRDTDLGEVDAAKIAAAPNTIDTAGTTLAEIDEVRNHPGRGIGTGFTSMGNNIRGTPGYDFENRVKQLTSGAFLVAIQQMRGMGALSNAEGQTATAALTRMDTATSEGEFLDALDDYQKIVERGRDKAQTILDGQKGSGKRLKWNPQTGELE